MSFRDTINPLSAFTACVAGWAITLSITVARAEEPAVTASPDSCMASDQMGVPPPPGADCTEYQLRLEQQARRMESVVKIMEQKAKRMELLAKSKASQEQLDKRPAPALPQNTPTPLPLRSPGGMDTDRVLEVFGEQARIRYRGGELLVRKGQALPEGGSVSQVSLEGVALIEGGNRRVLPFYLGVVQP